MGYDLLMGVFRSDHRKDSALNLHPGEIAEVRDENEIAATLDESEALEGLLFMPAMYAYSGKRFRVLRRADKIIVEGFGMRHLRNTVILDNVTCEGDALEGCERTCMVLWKEAWLRRAEGAMKENHPARKISNQEAFDVRRNPAHGLIACQSSKLMEASFRVSRWDIRKFLWNMTSGVYEPSELVSAFFFSISIMANTFLGRSRYHAAGFLMKTPAASLNLKPGDSVRIKSKEDILQTLDGKGRNRGLEFTPEMEKYCGGTYSVIKQVNRMLNEKTRKMRQISHTVLLKNVNCDGRAHGGCPRNCYCLWREIWLEIAERPSVASQRAR